MRWVRGLKSCLIAGLAFLALGSFLYSIHATVSGPEQEEWRGSSRRRPSSSVPGISEIGCVINGAELEEGRCLRDADDIYLPFQSLIQPYFEIHGFFESQVDGEERFIWWHNGSRIGKPGDDAYSVRSAFGPFASYNVEGRDRVRCINGLHGVPMSVQWGKTPYFYPIQIAQFGLQHYSKNITAEAPIEQDLLMERWESPKGREGLNWNGTLLSIDTQVDPNSEAVGMSVPVEARSLGLLVLEGELGVGASITLLLRKDDTGPLIRLHYHQEEDACVLSPLSKHSFVHGIGSHKAGKRTLIRNVPIDLAKVLSAPMRKKKKGDQKERVRAESVRLLRVEVRGSAKLHKLSLTSSAHSQLFLAAADWFLQAQDEEGGWPVPVRRTLVKDKLFLNAGWYSAMAQGHAMSVLSRAYLATGKEAYLRAAEKGLALFSKPAAEGGVRNTFLSSVDWYEEYPTRPGSFVLNGFLYSLLGLRDLSEVLDNEEASSLLETGLESLASLLPLFDNGSGSFYDLRHVTVGGLEPNRARSDYHTLHIYQLLWLAQLYPAQPLWRTTAERWIQYALGHRARHN